MKYQCDEEGLYCPECGLNPHFCRCESVRVKQIETMVRNILRLQSNYFEPLGKEWHLDEPDQELISLN